MSLWPLIGIAVVVVGFVLRFNPLLVVVAAAAASALTAGLSPHDAVAAFGKAFKDSRIISLVWMILPVIGLLERAGLQEKARSLIGAIKGVTTSRLLMLYLLIRQLTAAVGLTSLGGHPQMVRPLIAPMAEAAAEANHGPLTEESRETIRAQSAATDNIGLFFGEDIFIAIGSIVLIQSFLEKSGIFVQPLHLSLWAIPTGICALLIHGARLWFLEARLKRLQAQPATPAQDSAS